MAVKAERTHLQTPRSASAGDVTLFTDWRSVRVNFDV